MLDLHTQLDAAKKIKKVIESCTTIAHLKAANRMLDLFFKQYSVESKTLFSNNVTYHADASTVKLYNNLSDLLRKKSKGRTFTSNRDIF